MRCPTCHHLNPDDAPRCSRCGAPFGAHATPTHDLPGLLVTGQTLLGRYTIGDLLGDGTMGSVYRATDTVLGRTVALKVLNPELWESSRARERMAREASVLGRIDHPNVIKIFNVFEHGAALVLELEYVSHGTLADRLRGGRLPVPEAARIARDMLEGLAAIHAAGIVHRDLKPSNVLMTEDGTPKLADLGVAHDAGAKGLTRTGTALGTVDYMSPEQIRGSEVGPGADIYACGIVLHEMLTGSLPFDTRNEFAVMAAHLEQAPNLRTLQSTAPAALVHAVARALAKDPAQRWTSAHELATVVAKHAVPKPASSVDKTLPEDQLRISREQARELAARRDHRPRPTPPRSPRIAQGPIGADTLISSLAPGANPNYGKCLPIAAALLAIGVLLALLLAGAVTLGIFQLRSGRGLKDLVEQSR